MRSAAGALERGVAPLDLALRLLVALRRALARRRRGPGRRIGELVLERGERRLGRLDLALERGDQLLAVLRGRSAGRFRGSGWGSFRSVPALVLFLRPAPC